MMMMIPRSEEGEGGRSTMWREGAGPPRRGARLQPDRFDWLEAPGRKRRAAELRAIELLRDDGFDYRQIADLLGRSDHLVRRRLAELELRGADDAAGARDPQAAPPAGSPAESGAQNRPGSGLEGGATVPEP
jgi:hypothetical protein